MNAAVFHAKVGYATQHCSFPSRSQACGIVNSHLPDRLRRGAFLVVISTTESAKSGIMLTTSVTDGWIVLKTEQER